MTHVARISLGDCETPMLRDPGGRTLAFSLVHAIGRAVVGGAYTDKAFPSESDLAKGYGISLSVTREATKMLAVKGLLGSIPQRGTFVLPSDHWNLFDSDVLQWLVELREPATLLRQLHELCWTIEPEAAAIAAQHATPAQVSAIATELDKLVAARVKGIGALDDGLAFHVAVLRASNNPFFASCSQMVAAALGAAIRCAGRTRKPDRDLASFQAVRNAIAAGDSDAALFGMRTLIDDELGWSGPEAAPSRTEEPQLASRPRS